ncbi:MAG TPA: D-2-hydroxyacid dehydrogenase [Candidatus Limnocylindrales bacterium]|nr:D-2-hydroxyacid dehydrogenase [Candidatus Limnocylindrales bacterium]
MRGAVVVSDHVEERFGRRIELIAPRMPRLVLRGNGLDGDPGGAEIAYFSGDLYPERGRDFFLPMLEAHSLKWLHSFSAGVDHPVFHRFLEAGVRLTTSSGASSATIAETAMLFVLHLSRRFWRYEQARAERAWRPHDVQELAGATMLIVGMGPIGNELARRAHAFGMNVVALTRTPRLHDGFPARPLTELDDALAAADYVVLALPLTPQTRGMFDASRLARMKPGAFFINVARGELVDEPALIQALQRGELAGAALDVFAEEPLPESSPLWTMPNVIVTPHASGRSLQSNDRATEIFLDNLARYLRDEPLRNEVHAGDTGASS